LIDDECYIGSMLAMIQDLIRHKWTANAALLTSIRSCDSAASDEAVRNLLQHILVANRYWLALTLERPFDLTAEMRVPAAFDDLIRAYRQTEADEMNWFAICQETDLDRPLESQFLPGQKTTVAQAILQICMHSQGHRSQCAIMLRELGGTPPPTDFVQWLKDRAAPSWPVS
jgi:uncharacterized damage-inducible protein DinB